MTAWASSGLSCKDYAARAGVNPRTLTWWKSKLASVGAAGPAPVSFVEVTEQLTAPASSEVAVIAVLSAARLGGAGPGLTAHPRLPGHVDMMTA
ncbi:IS66 family insertion sequence element accessory protein TnpA [Nannocystis bainbridge]|uniref:Transposase n=1 Tax=Nannocystis bainbridge TaxID=2995303 RepID=A0ABT5ECQ1_9BACT|nr:hypothetical protein [Nannocystis bainbridge]